MSDKVYAEHSMTVEEFSKDPAGAFQRLDCNTIAVTSDGVIIFYASAKHDYEEILDAYDYEQRGTTEINDAPSKMMEEDIDLDEIARKMAEKLKDVDEGDVEEWK